MTSNKNYLITATVSALFGMLLAVNGCEKSGSELEKAAGDSIQLCLHCGQIKDSSLCCQPNQPKCTHCGLVKNSPGCCNIPKDAKTAAICTKCGQIKDSTMCCKPNQPKCLNCGLVKDSPGCCKLPKI